MFSKFFKFFLFIFLLQYGFAQINYTGEIPLKESNYARTIINNNYNTYWSHCSDMILGTTIDSVNYTNPVEFYNRIFLQWNIGEALIPYGSHIDSVRLVIDNIRNSGGNELRVLLYNAKNQVYNTATSTLWNYTKNISDSLADVKSVSYQIDKTFYSGSKLCQAVQSSLDSTYFTLGLRTRYYSDPSYTINQCDIKLAYYFTLPPKTIVLNQTFNGLRIWFY